MLNKCEKKEQVSVQMALTSQFCRWMIKNVTHLKIEKKENSVKITQFQIF